MREFKLRALSSIVRNGGEYGYSCAQPVVCYLHSFFRCRRTKIRIRPIKLAHALFLRAAIKLFLRAQRVVLSPFFVGVCLNKIQREREKSLQRPGEFLLLLLLLKVALINIFMSLAACFKGIYLGDVDLWGRERANLDIFFDLLRNFCRMELDILGSLHVQT